MIDFSARRSMDDFLVNPTDRRNNDEGTHNSSKMDDVILSTRSDGLSAFKGGNKAVEPTGRIDNFNGEASYLQGYTSDEEIASPVENENSDFQPNDSDTDSLSPISESASVEQLPQATSAAVQLCGRAQAVQFVSAGKAKVVSTPKAVDISSADATTSTENSPITPTSMHRMNRRNFEESVWFNNNQEKASPRTSSENPATSPVLRFDNSPGKASPRDSTEQSANSPVPPSGPAKRNVLRKHHRRPIQLRLEIATRNHSPQLSTSSTEAPVTAQRSESTNYDPYPATPGKQIPSAVSISPPGSAPKRSMHELSSSFSIRGIRRRRTQSTLSESSASDVSDRSKDPHSANIFPPSPSVRSLMPQACNAPKMVPRGGNERAAPIVLPPCPKGYNDDCELVPEVGRPPRRQDSLSSARRPANKTVPKMVPRGGDEREPAIVLPPCPDDYDDDCGVPQWPARKDSVANLTTPDQTPDLQKHTRRKSLSAAFVTAQA